jgi:hypothetical protein
METTSGAGNFVLGVASTGTIQLIYGLTVVLGGTGVVSNFAADLARFVTFVVTGSNAFFINTGAAFSIGNGTFSGTPTTADIHYTSVNEAVLVNHAWSGNAPKVDNVNGAISGHVTFGVHSFDALTGDIVSAVPVDILDREGATVVTGVTNASGNIVFGSVGTILENALKVERIMSSPSNPTYDARGPFTARVNLTGTTLSQYAGYEYKFSAPYTDLPNGYGKQYRPFMLDLPMAAPVAAGTQTFVIGAGTSHSIRPTPEIRVEVPPVQEEDYLQRAAAMGMDHSAETLGRRLSENE